jgi:hypothetical protein
VLSAWSADQGISLGALASEGKSNEIKTIPKLLDTINIQGAMGCQRSIAAKIRERQGDYALQVKANPCGRVVIQRLDIKTEGVSISRDQSTSEFRMLRGWCPAYSGRNSVLGSSWELQEPVITMLREKCKSQGTPQGGVISPVLANLFLHYVFDKWMQKHHPQLKWCRYADDGLVHRRSEAEAKQMLEVQNQRFSECGLALHPDKT